MYEKEKVNSDTLRHLETPSYFQDILSHLKTTKDILRAMSVDTTYIMS